jgi:MYXO-CTERM domain-containing protein
VVGALGLALSIGSAAHAESVTIDGLSGNPFTLEARTMAKLVPPGGVIGDTKLAKLHAKLNDAGIKTNGKVTFILAQTNLGGLSFVTLVDKKKANPSGNSSQSSLFMQTEATSGVGVIQGSDSDLGAATNESGLQSVDGNFQWNSNGTGDAFAWTDLNHGDGASFQFAANSDDPATFPGLKDLNTFQFVTWTGNGWQVVKAGSFSDGTFSFSFAVAPVPPAAVLGLAGLAGVAAVRRRMSR